MKEKRKMLLGLAFLIFLEVSYVENIFFFQFLGDVFQNQLLAIFMFFIHNVLAISLILLGMA
jgi:hypothetical protein